MRRFHAVLLCIIGSASIACGGGGNKNTGAGSTPSPTATRISLPSFDQATADEMMKGLVTQADLGAEWQGFRAEGGVLRDVGPTSRIGCAVEPNGFVKPSEVRALVDGPIFQRGTTKRFVTSSSLGFADEVAAQSAIEALRDPKWSECWVSRKTQVAKAENADTKWRVDPIDDTERGQGGLEGIVRFQFQALVDGQLVDANGYETVFIYRVRRAVLIVTAEGIASEGEPPEVLASLDQELHAATQKALQRLQG